jgi:ubiquinone/menaquinone biosynthesis C-methylase UbiE
MRKDDTIEHYKSIVKGKYGEYYERINPDVLKQKPFLAEETRKLFAHLLPRDPDSIVDFGCGAAWYFPILSRFTKKLVGLDISEDLLKLAGELVKNQKIDNVDLKHYDGERMPFEDNSQSCVCEWDTLHHVEKIDHALDEIHRVLKPGGVFVGIEPNVFNFLMAVYHIRRRHENRALIINRVHLKKLLARRFSSVQIQSNNTVISYNSDFYQKIINIINLMFTKVPVLRLFSLRYLFIAQK